MVIDLTVEQESILRRISEHEGKSLADVLVETALWIESKEPDADEMRVIDDRLAEAERTEEWISHEAVGERLRMMLRG